MAGAFARSWTITATTFGILKNDKDLIVFPIIAAIVSVLFLFLMSIPFLMTYIMQAVFPKSLTWIFYFAVFALYFGMSLISVFFNVCVVYTIKNDIEGRDVNFQQAMHFAFSRFKLILQWSLLAASVGLILRMIENIIQRMGIAGRLFFGLLESLLGALWSVLIIFVVPAMVYHDLGPLDAIKNSVQKLKKTWGEALILGVGMGFAFMLMFFIGIFIGVLLTFSLMYFLSVAGAAIGIFITIAYIVVLIFVFSIMSTIYNTVLYVYADTGVVPIGYTEEELKGALSSRKSKLF